MIPPCRLSPWDEPISQIFEGTWVIAIEDFVVINDKQFDIDEKLLNIEDIVDVFRGWV